MKTNKQTTKHSMGYHLILSVCLRSGLDKLNHLFPLKFTLLVRQAELLSWRTLKLSLKDTPYLLKEFN